MNFQNYFPLNVNEINKLFVASVRDIMTEKVISVFPETPLIDAAKVLAYHHFDGVPVVDKNNKLIGILTEYDLVSKGSVVHLPTFQIILKNLKIFRKDKSQFKKEFEEIFSLTVRDVMNREPLTLSEEATYEEAVAAFREHHRGNPIPVINKQNQVVGVVSRFDVLKPLQAMAD